MLGIEAGGFGMPGSSKAGQWARFFKYCHLFGGIFTLVALSACATAPRFHLPKGNPQPYLSRALKDVKSQDGVRVTMAVLRPDESEAVFGLPLADQGIQPVWLRIENSGDTSFRFMPVFLDRDYYSAREVAFLFHSSSADDAGIERELTSQQMPLYIPPHGTVSGYVYTNRSLGMKLVNVELLGHRQLLRFSFARTLPSGEFDYGSLDVEKLYAKDRLQDLPIDSLRSALSAMPCCTTDEPGKTLGDPLNVVVVGDEQEILLAFVRGGWDFTDTVNSGTVRRMVSSFLFGNPYRNAPVSPLYFEGRHQDFAMQRARSTVSQRNHMRLWLTPLRVEGKPVWIAQVSRDIGVRFTKKTPFLTTHAIDPDVDEARDFVLEDLLVTGSLAQWGLVRGVGEARIDKPRTNLTGDHYFTDGLRLVLFVSTTNRAITDVEMLGWETVPSR
jgi:hypothetical protein